MKAIEQLWAWIAEEPGEEGVCSMQMGQEHFPMVAGKTANAMTMRTGAEFAHRQSGYPVRLVRFVRAEVVEELPS